ncbi:sphingomyelinase family [Grosmannia clavigera kw1407]|uniref:Sphingomyelinase family n=1 Tax=Grosmannia clavigera (strain kw1407 / UAMH 11150) TaxID=655863 RepID=F0XF00_GROCL|nr:sphingomyelinase family [Grosmannia clavigera kw1407]EFX04657.1 sphingomyelinase family [Grosmannia clavigera kw1407]
MPFFMWCAQRLGGLAMVSLALLSFLILSMEFVSRYGYSYNLEDNPDGSRYSPNGTGILTVVFSWYCLFIHVLVTAFPLRACWAIWDLTSSLRTTAQGKTCVDYEVARLRHNSPAPLSSLKTQRLSHISQSASNGAGDLKSNLYENSETGLDHIIHAIIIPNYKEEMDTLRETLDVLASHPRARSGYDIYLAMEQREPDADVKALSLIKEFAEKFRFIDFTIHPTGIPGDCPGKGSNVNWAARKLSEMYPIACRKDVVVTGIDADSHLLSNYFALVAMMHKAYPETATTTLYAAPIIFDRNADRVPAILVDWVGGWDCNSEAIGEDLHMYTKCFFALNGNLTVRTVLSPISQSNVTAGGFGKGVIGIRMDMGARYKQALRHMWGALDTGFALYKVIEVWQNRERSSCAFRPLHEPASEVRLAARQSKGSPKDAARAGSFTDVTHGVLKGPDYQRIFYLLHRLFEAHFLPVQMTGVILASAAYKWVTDGTPDIHGVNWIFSVCKGLRTFGFIEVAFYLFLYESYHKIALSIREKEMNNVGLAEADGSTDTVFLPRSSKEGTSTRAGLAMDDPSAITVLTLNCWGLKFVSAFREERLAEIGRRLAVLAAAPDAPDPTGSTDPSSPVRPPVSIVALQECWCQSDFETVQALTRDVLPHGKFFRSGVWGAGLAVLSCWPITQASMHAYALNGRPTAFWRGDWFVGKGIASATVRVSPRLVVDVLVTHTHAPYEAGRPDDSYLAHQLAQTWEMGRRAAAAAERGGLGLSARLVVAVGDFNMLPQSLPYQMLQLGARAEASTSPSLQLLDSWRVLHPQSSFGPAACLAKQARQKLQTTAATAAQITVPTAAFNLTENGATSDNVLNTWRWPKDKQKRLLQSFRNMSPPGPSSAVHNDEFDIAPDTPDPCGKRLDYIFYMSSPPIPPNADSSSIYHSWTVKTARVAMVEPHPTLGCSVSDHFAVEATLALEFNSQDSDASGRTDETADVDVYNSVLAEIDRYIAREHRQQFWRSVHFFSAVFVAVACHVAMWFVPRLFVAFLLMLLSSLGLAAGAIDGLLALLFFGSEIRNLEEFRWQVSNARAAVAESLTSLPSSEKV